MEKILTTEERIRRAEEIYERRKNQKLKNRTATVNVGEKKNFRLFKKLILQILMCGIIYSLLFWGQSTTYFSSQEHIEKIKQILSYDMNFQNIYQNIQSKVMKWNNKEEVIEKEEGQENQESNQVLPEATLSATDTASTEETIELTQMEQDANAIKEQYSLLKPIEGQISSGFGQRESTSSMVSTNHSGIDIAAQEGTKIKAAMDGNVTIATNSSSYRKLY